MNTHFSFQSQAACSHTQARAGVFLTPHGSVETPRFMP
ncbi:MAG: tRNA guanosine(34) transglycosylase Tgt, partial [Leptolyngbyaceae cyanobacterium CAN_BIN12]|nr:tRNA guanosine(34) transglycosylase Tgt [Leptolyngbyaceae cyanobacterium CAN_BIN12]